MKFNTIIIAGLGLIGGSLAAALRKLGVANLIGIDHQLVVQKALAADFITEGCPLENPGAVDRALAHADLIVLAAPIQQILNWLERLSGKVKVGTLITDVGSTKEVIVATAKKRLPRGVYFLGGHPMAGSEKSGLEHASTDLFQNSVYVLTEPANAPEDLVNEFSRIVKAIGARPLFLAAAEHDRAAAVISHLPQIVATALLNFAGRRNETNPTYFQMAGGGFRGVTRLAGSSWQVWGDIFKTNSGNIENALDDYIEELSAFKHRLASDRVADDFRGAAMQQCLWFENDREVEPRINNG